MGIWQIQAAVSGPGDIQTLHPHTSPCFSMMQTPISGFLRQPCPPLARTIVTWGRKAALESKRLQNMRETKFDGISFHKNTSVMKIGENSVGR